MLLWFMQEYSRLNDKEKTIISDLDSSVNNRNNIYSLQFDDYICSVSDFYKNKEKYALAIVSLGHINLKDKNCCAQLASIDKVVRDANKENSWNIVVHFYIEDSVVDIFSIFPFKNSSIEDFSSYIQSIKNTCLKLSEKDPLSVIIDRKAYYPFDKNNKESLEIFASFLKKADFDLEKIQNNLEYFVINNVKIYWSTLKSSSNLILRTKLCLKDLKFAFYLFSMNMKDGSIFFGFDGKEVWFCLAINIKREDPHEFMHIIENFYYKTNKLLLLFNEAKVPYNEEALLKKINKIISK